MNGHRNADADVKGVSEREQLKKPLFWKKHDDGDSHGEGNGGVRRRPTPKNAAAIKSEPKFTADVIAHHVRRMDASGKKFVNGGNEPANKRGLANRPADQFHFGISKDEPADEHCDRHEHRQKHSGGQRRPPPAMRNNISRGDEIKPIESGQDERERERDGEQMPKNQPAFETSEDVTWQGRKEIFHTDFYREIRDQLKTAYCLSQLNATSFPILFFLQEFNIIVNLFQVGDNICFGQSSFTQ